MKKGPMMKTTAKLWIWLLTLAILSPLGLLLPAFFKAGDAWGEWGRDTIKKLAGYIPEGLEKLSGIWHAPISEYAFRGWEEKGWRYASFAYIISAAIGIALTALIMLAFGKLLTKKKNKP